MIQFDDTTNETREYAEFIEKFKPKKTTDDCYTPGNIYDVVPVSYTHLDVYKRQLEGWTMR